MIWCRFTTNGQPAQLDILAAGDNSIRLTLKPTGSTADFANTPALADRQYAAPVISITNLITSITKRIGQLNVQVSPHPLTITVTDCAIIPFDPVRQYTGEKVHEPTTIRVY